MKTIIQCDFDGTITEDDVSFLIYDTFGDGSWRELFKEYQKGKIPVGIFNTKAFAMVKTDEQALFDLILKSDKVRMRPGFRELLHHCSQNDLEFVIVSNGLVFYIEAILKNMGINDIKVFAAESRFTTDKGMEVKYIGPEGREVMVGFKEAHTELFLRRGYRVIYVGNGVSDIYPAQRAHHIFATGDMLGRCSEINLNCTPFNDLNDVVRGLELLPLN